MRVFGQNAFNKFVFLFRLTIFLAHVQITLIQVKAKQGLQSNSKEFDTSALVPKTKQ